MQSTTPDPQKKTTPKINVTWCAAAAVRLTTTPFTSARPEPCIIQS